MSIQDSISISFTIVDGVEGRRMEFLGPERTVHDRRDKHFHQTFLSPKGLRFRDAIFTLRGKPFVPPLLDHDRHDLNWFTLPYLGETHIPPSLFILRCKSQEKDTLFENFMASLETFFQTLLEKDFYLSFDLNPLDIMLVHKETGDIQITDFSEFYRYREESSFETPLRKIREEYYS